MGLSSTCPYCRREATWCSVQTLALGWPKTRLATSSGFRMAAADTCLQDRMKIGFEETCHEENISLPLGLQRGDPRSTALKWIFLFVPFLITTIFAPYSGRQKSTCLVFFIVFPSLSQLHIGNQLLQNDPCCQRAKASYSAQTEVLASPNFQGRLHEVRRTGAGTSGSLQGATWALLEELPYSCAMNIDRQTTNFQTTSEKTMYY